METVNLNFDFRGLSFNTRVDVIDRDFWLFGVNYLIDDGFTLQFDFFTDTWKYGSDQLEDPKWVQAIGDELMKIYGKEIQSHRADYLISSPEYFLRKLKDKTIIGFWGKKIRIVTSRSFTRINKNEKEVHYYGTINGSNFFFETQNYNGEDRGVILRAIRWYAIYINHPLMKINSKLFH